MLTDVFRSNQTLALLVGKSFCQYKFFILVVSLFRLNSLLFNIILLHPLLQISVNNFWVFSSVNAFTSFILKILGIKSVFLPVSSALLYFFHVGLKLIALGIFKQALNMTINLVIKIIADRLFISSILSYTFCETLFLELLTHLLEFTLFLEYCLGWFQACDWCAIFEFFNHF